MRQCRSVFSICLLIYKSRFCVQKCSFNKHTITGSRARRGYLIMHLHNWYISEMCVINLSLRRLLCSTCATELVESRQCTNDAFIDTSHLHVIPFSMYSPRNFAQTSFYNDVHLHYRQLHRTGELIVPISYCPLAWEHDAHSSPSQHLSTHCPGEVVCAFQRRYRQVKVQQLRTLHISPPPPLDSNLPNDF